MYWDYVASSNGLGFHAPQEAARILGRAVDLAQECRLETQRIRARKGEIRPLEMPDISTREKAQAFIRPYLEAQKAAAAGE
jgi:nitrite reductase (cytochrome c-552)